MELGDMRGYLMVIRAFRQLRQTNSMVSRGCWSFDFDYFQYFAGFYSSRRETCKLDDTQDFSLLGGGQSSSMAWGSVVVVPLYRFQDTEVLLTHLIPFLSF